MTAPDIIGDAYGLRDEERARPRRPLFGTATAVAASGWTIGVIATAISAVLGTAIFAAVSLSGGGVQPEELLPGSSFAFAKVDFDPPAGQKLAVRGLTKRFPDAPADELVGLRNELIRSLIDDGEVPLDFEKDIEPWLGDRVGVAAFMNSDDEPEAVVALQTSDADATRRAIEKGAEGDATPAMEFRRGYAIIAEDAESLREALALTDKESLADYDRYQADRSEIGDDQIVVGWADNKMIGQVFMGELSGYEEESGGDTLTDALEDAFRGRTILGVHAAPRHVELEVVSLDAAPGGGGALPTTMQGLPDDTVAAMYVHNLARVADDIGATLGAFGAVGSGAFFPYLLYGGLLESDQVFLDGEEEEVEYASPPADVGQAPPLQCVQPPDNTGDGDPACPPFEVPPELQAEMEQARKRSKALETLSETLLPMLRGETTLALLGVPGEGTPAVGLAAKVAAPGNAVSPLAAVMSAWDLDPRAVTTSGGTLLAATDRSTLDTLGRGGALGSTDAFEAAMGELTGDTAAAIYVSLDALEAIEDYPDELTPLRAVGIVVTETPGRAAVRFRVVVDG